MTSSQQVQVTLVERRATYSSIAELNGGYARFITALLRQHSPGESAPACWREPQPKRSAGARPAHSIRCRPELSNECLMLGGEPDLTRTSRERPD